MKRALLVVLLLLPLPLLAPGEAAPPAPTSTLRPLPMQNTLATVDASPSAGLFSSTAELDDGVLRVAYVRKDESELVYAERSPEGTWTRTVVDATPGRKWHVDLRMGPNGPAIAYHTQPGALHVAFREGGTWRAELVASGQNRGLFPSLGFDVAGTAHVVYADSFPGFLYHAVRTPVGWTETVIDRQRNAGIHSSLLVRGTDLFVAYQAGIPTVLKAARASGGAVWTTEVIDDTPSAGQFTSVTVLPDGRIAIGYQVGATTEVRAAIQDGSEWTIESVDRSGAVGWGLAATRAPSGRLALAYKEALDGAVNLRLAYRTEEGWRAGVVERTTGNPTYHDRLDIRASDEGVFHAFYRREVDNVLRHARIVLLGADFDWTPAAPVSLQPATFRDRSETLVGPIVNWTWTFPGRTAYGSQVTHTFTSGGAFPVTLTVRSAMGHTASATRTVPVGNQPPVAVISAIPRATVDLPVTIDGSQSYDVDGTVVHWAWSFSDGTTATGPVVAKKFTVGSHTIRLNVTDNLGAVGSATRPLLGVREYVFKLTMTKSHYGMFEPQDGRITVEAIQGGPIGNHSLFVNVIPQAEGQLKRGVTADNLVPRLWPGWSATLKSDANGVARFQVPLGFFRQLGGFSAETLSIPTTLPGPTVLSYYLVEGYSNEPGVSGRATTSYEVGIFPDPFNLQDLRP